MNITYQAASPENFLLAMLVIFSVPYLVWRYLKTDNIAPMVVIQIVMGIILGPSVMGAYFPEYYDYLFSPAIIHSLSGIAWWAVMLFVFIAGLELDFSDAWKYRKDSAVTASLALCFPLMFGACVGLLLLEQRGWVGEAAKSWQFVLGIGMSCAVTALPILVLLMEKLEILRLPIGQRILRYASLDDIAVWIVLAVILLDWSRLSRQLIFVVTFSFATFFFRKMMRRIAEEDRWHFAIIWLVVVSLGADWCGLHFMVGAFLAGAVIDRKWFDQVRMDYLRSNILLVIMPVFFLSTGLRTNWPVGDAAVLMIAASLLCAAVSGKLFGLHIAGKILRWQKGEATIIGWLLQTKALIMIIFANVLLDMRIISGDTFAALLIMAIASTMLTVPMVAPKIVRCRSITANSDGADV